MLNRKAVRRVLRDWDSLKALGENPLIDLHAVRTRHQSAGYTHTPVGYGLALREVFQSAINSMRPETDSPGLKEKRWRAYIILTEQFLQGRSPVWVKEQLHVSKGTYYGEQERALDMLVERLQKEEVESTCRSGAPLQDSAVDNRGTPEAPYMAPLRPSHPIVGREELFENLKDQLLKNEGRTTLALEGLPGVGKTAIAVELAHDPDIKARFRDGILWVGLGRQPDLSALLGYWAAAMGVSSDAFASRSSLVERSALIRSAIGLRRMLLVIDDAWQIEAALAFMVGGPNCVHLLTTRLVDLALDFTGSSATVIHELDLVDGLELLAQVSPYAVQVSPEQSRLLVQRVGGLPLALILVGRYLQKESFNHQNRRLRQALDRLQAAEARLQVAQPQSLADLHPDLPVGTPLSLQVVIGLSDAALGDVAHRALLDLSLFAPKPNTFSEEAGLAVADIPVDVLDLLVDHGLLECTAPDRYTLHQTVVDYAACTVYAPYVVYMAPSKGASLKAAGRMVAYFAGFAETHANDFPSLELEITNLLAACEIASRTGRHLMLVRLAVALFAYLDLRGLYQVCQPLLQQALTAAESLEDQANLAAVLYRLGSLEIKHGNFMAAWHHLNRGIKLARQTASRSCEADSLFQMGFVCLNIGNFLLGRSNFEQAVHLFEELHRPKEYAIALSALGFACEELCDFTQARTYMEEALVACQESGNRQGEGWTHYNLALVFIPLGDFPQARIHADLCHDIYQELGDRRGLGWLHYQYGRIFLHLGDLESARASFSEALGKLSEIGDRMGQGYAIHNLGLVMNETGEYTPAESHFSQALAIFENSSCRAGISQCYHSLGMQRARLDDYAGARAYLEQALALCQKIGFSRGECVTLADLAALLNRLGDWKTALDCGRRAVLMAREIGAHPTHAYALTCLGDIFADQGCLEEAQSAYQQALILRQAMGQPHLASGLIAKLEELASPKNTNL